LQSDKLYLTDAKLTPKSRCPVKIAAIEAALYRASGRPSAVGNLHANCQHLHCVSKNCHRFFQNNSVKRGPISIIFGILSPEETLAYRAYQKVVNLSTLPEICKIKKKDFSGISLKVFECFSYLPIKQTHTCHQSVAEIITVYLFSRLREVQAATSHQPALFRATYNNNRLLSQPLSHPTAGCFQSHLLFVRKTV